MEKKVAIIGAGLTGLSAGIYLQQSRIRTEIFEIFGNGISIKKDEFMKCLSFLYINSIHVV